MRELQIDFVRHVLYDDTSDTFVAGVAGGAVAAEARLGIYRNNAFITLTEALAAVFPVVRQLVGEDFFASVAHRYIREHPCRSGNLHDFGAEFPAHLGGDERAAALEYLADVARLELARDQVFHAPGADMLDVAALGRIDPGEFEALHFELHPGARLVSSHYPVLTIWEAHQGGPLPESIDLGTGAEHVLVLRPQWDIEMQRLDAAEYALLAAIAADKALADATDAALAADDEFDLDACLVKLVSGYVITGFHL